MASVWVLWEGLLRREARPGTEQMMQDRRAVQVKHDPLGAPGGESETVRVELLGGFRISVGSRALRENGWRLKKAGSLIKLLALAPDHQLHREQVMEWLWPELDPKAAANNLRYALYAARRVLEPTATTTFRYLQRCDGQLILCPDGPLWTDVEAFEEAAAAARRTFEPEAYQAAVDLYAGELLPQDRYEKWAEDRRGELRQTYLTVLSELAGLYEKRDDFESAIEALSKAVASDPTHEEAYVELMRLYTASGQRYKAILRYEQLRNTLSREFASEPGAASQRLYEEIRAGRLSGCLQPKIHTPGVPPQNLGHNLPVARTSFVGREAQVVDVKRLLAMTRLLTLTGPCGCGKTRLALTVARDLVEAYPDGTWLVELAAFSDPTLLLQAVAAALEVREQTDRPLITTLKDSLCAKKLLLVLDNCEHLVEDVAGLVEALLDSCPELRVLATSREALGVTGELAWRVPSLSAPDPSYPTTVENLVRFESARLFLERARCRNPAFALTQHNVPAVAEICRRLEGIPLAIELAAARVGMLSVERIAERLGNCLKLLVNGNRMAPLRQRTLRGALDWSYELLSEPERKLFGRLSVFAGGWTLEAAEAVGSGSGIEEGDILDLLSRLVDKSLVATEESGDGEIRYRMLEPMRQYGREKLQESEEADAVSRRHVAFFLALSEEADLGLKGPRQAAWLERLEEEHDNLRAAVQWSLERGKAELGLRFAGALGEFWCLRGHLNEGRRWLEVALAKSGEELLASARAKALVRAGYVAWEQGEYERSMALGEESLALSRKLGDKVGAATALYTLGWAAMFGNEIKWASALIEEAITLQREVNDPVGVARSLLILGFVANCSRDHKRATALYQKSLTLAREAGDSFGIILSLEVGALAALGLGDYQRTRALCEEGLRKSRQLKTMHLTAAYLHVTASLAGLQGQPVRAARLWGAAESLREAIGTVLSPFEDHLYRPYIGAARARLEEAAWEVAWDKGKTMPLEEAVEYALAIEEAWSRVHVQERSSVDRQPAALTSREQEVAVLVGQGLTNRQISAQLVLSEHTAATHVRKILKKLGLHSRTQIAAWVAEQPLSPSYWD